MRLNPCRRGSRLQGPADRRTNRMLRRWETRYSARLWPKPRIRRAEGQAWLRRTLDISPAACRIRGLRSGDGIPGRCIQRWAYEWLPVFAVLTPLESICGNFANRFWWGGTVRARTRARADSEA